jgi:3-deoxy-D-manno-octulosonate 8-phosphate phosphatase (KDO 8-P phosphatase)
MRCRLEESDLRARAEKIRLLVLDCDGVLTDGSIVYDQRGGDIKRFFVRDGFAIRCWQRAGLRVAVISGRYSPSLAVRCRELDLSPVIQSAPNKEPAFRDVLSRCGVDADEVCVMGDDLPDLPIMLAAGLSIAVADADPEVTSRVDAVTESRGGRGAVREAIEQLLMYRGAWGDVIAHYTRRITV